MGVDSITTNTIYIIYKEYCQTRWQLRHAAQGIAMQIEKFQIIEPAEDARRQAAQVIVIQQVISTQIEIFQIIEPTEDARRQAAQVIARQLELCTPTTDLI